MIRLLKKFKFRLKKRQAIREKIIASEYPASGFIPYKGYWNENTVITNDNALMQFVKINGFSFETADDEDLDIKKNLRNMLFKGLGNSGIGLYFHIIRRKQMAYSEDYSAIDMPDGFALYLDDKWVARHKNKESYINELYITVIKKPASSGALSGIENIVKSVIRGTDKAAWQATMQEVFEELEEATGRIVNSLRDYSPQILGIVESNEGIYSEISEFLGAIVNCGERSKYMISPA